MDREEYFSNMEALVDSPNTDRKLDADPTQQHRAIIVSTLLPMQQYPPTSTYCPLLPSLLFSLASPRSIVLCCNTIFAALTKECGRILARLVGKTRHQIKDSVDLVEKLKDIVFPPNYSLRSFDLKH